MIPQSQSEFIALLTETNRPCRSVETATAATIHGVFGLLNVLDDEELVKTVRACKYKDLQLN
jgi:hypothetical protein